MFLVIDFAPDDRLIIENMLYGIVAFVASQEYVKDNWRSIISVGIDAAFLPSSLRQIEY